MGRGSAPAPEPDRRCHATEPAASGRTEGLGAAAAGSLGGRHSCPGRQKEGGHPGMEGFLVLPTGGVPVMVDAGSVARAVMLALQR